MQASFPQLDQYLSSTSSDPALSSVILAMGHVVAPALAKRLALGTLAGDPERVVGRNDSGDMQKALDVWAHDLMIQALSKAPVRAVLSEEAEAPTILDPDGAFDVAVDPIDGSGSLGLGAPLGTLFAVWPATAESFSRPGREAVAAGYVSYGHSTDFGLTVGQGVAIATLDSGSGQFHVTDPVVTLPVDTGMVAFNASNERHWPGGLQAYLRDLRAGNEGPRRRDFNMRWLAAAVGELHRILRRGGTFLYPADSRPSYRSGRLRLQYEAVPIAFLIEQAGGMATDGEGAILDRIPRSLHEHVPLIFGDRDEVAVLQSYLRSA